MRRSYQSQMVSSKPPLCIKYIYCILALSMAYGVMIGLAYGWIMKHMYAVPGQRDCEKVIIAQLLAIVWPVPFCMGIIPL